MDNKLPKERISLDMRKIFRYMMEKGLYPIYEDKFITFTLDDNLAILDYEEGILSVRLFFTIEEEGYEIFLEASNRSMLQSFGVKATVMDDMRSIMFSCENLCYTKHDLQRFLPRMLELLGEGLNAHKEEMKKILRAVDVMKNKRPVTEDRILETGNINRKPLS